MSVCVAIVTYADRFHLLKQAVSHCLEEGVSKIAIIENGCSKNSIQKLKELDKKYNQIEVRWLGKNFGSAIGFKNALELAYQQNTSHILVLDDDNVPAQKTIKKLELEWQVCIKDHDESDLALLCYRKGRDNFDEIIRHNDGSKMLMPLNNFMGFHILELLKKFTERIFKNKHISKNQTKDKVQVPAAPYSGLFFNKALIERYGYPNSEFILYQDDFDFTLEFTSKNGIIWLLPDCIINDLERSEYLPEKKSFLYHSALDGNEISMFYSFRNMIYLTKKWLISNHLVYQLNKTLFWILIFIMAVLKGKKKRLKMLKIAASNGENERLGLHSKFPLS